MTHPLIEAAAEGRLPTWARAGRTRQEHMNRVAELMVGWAEALGLDREQVRRWKAVGHLHDVLREAPPGELLPLVDPERRALPAPLLHGPAGAERLRQEGVDDASFLRAVAFHTIGHPELDRMGRALYCADYLEPGRERRGHGRSGEDGAEGHPPSWRARRRERFPEEPDRVTLDVLRERVRTSLEEERPLPRETVHFWNSLVKEVAHGPPTS